MLETITGISYWFVRSLRNFVRRRALRASLIGAAVLIQQAAHSADTIEVRGVIDSALCNSITGERHPESDWHSRFVATISGSAWRVCVTNIDLEDWWEVRFYDGTNSYVLAPSGSNFMTSKTNRPRSDLFLATVTPSTVPVTLNADPLGTALACITFGFSARSVRTNKNGFVEMPAPWTTVRDNLGNWGYKWLIHDSPGGRFLSGLELIRDQRLDLNNKEELLRPELDYPETLGRYNS